MQQKVSWERLKKVPSELFTPHFVFLLDFFLNFLLYAPITHISYYFLQRYKIPAYLGTKTYIFLIRHYKYNTARLFL